MARSAPAYSAFTAGEISPKFEGRIEIQKYSEGLAELTNMIVLPSGGVTRRPGTEFIAEVKDSSVKTRLIPFQFKSSDTYILAFGDQIMRVYRNGQQVLNSSINIVTISNANPGVIYASNGFSNGDEVFITGVGGKTDLNDRNFKVANVTGSSFTLQDMFGNDIDTSTMPDYTSGGTVAQVFEVATPYDKDDIFDLRFAQSADTMYFVHPSYAVRTLTRSAHTTWTFATATINENDTPTLTSANNYPSVVTFFEQRLVFASSNNNPQTIWFSQNGDYTSFHTGTSASDALIYTIASNQVNDIRFLSPTRVLTIGTSGGEYVLTASNDGPVTPSSTVIRKYSNYGSSDTEPVQVADVTLFLQRGKRKVREFRYVGEVDVAGYAAPDMTIMAEHLTEGGIEEFAYQQEPDSVVWALRSDGDLLGLTYRREEQVVAWHRHEIGGSGVVESIATFPTDTGEDELYMIVKRTINSTTKRYIEKLSLFDFGNETTGSFFVDSGLSYSGSSATAMTGLHHLAGETVNVLANGAAHPDETVTSDGKLTLDYSSTTAAIGYGYDSTMQTMRIESGSSDGTSQGKPKRVHAVTVRFHETVGAKIGNDSTEVDTLPFRSSSIPMNQAVPLFSGDKTIEFRGFFEDDDRLYVKQTQPLPMTVLALFPRMNTFDI